MTDFTVRVREDLLRVELDGISNRYVEVHVAGSEYVGSAHDGVTSSRSSFDDVESTMDWFEAQLGEHLDEVIVETVVALNPWGGSNVE